MKLRNQKTKLLTLQSLAKLSILTLATVIAFNPDLFASADSFDANLDSEIERLLPMVGKVVAFGSFIGGMAMSMFTQKFHWLLGGIGTSVVAGFGSPVLNGLFSAVI